MAENTSPDKTVYVFRKDRAKAAESEKAPEPTQATESKKATTKSTATEKATTKSTATEKEN